MATKYRADQVGSFLRPKEVLDAHAAQAKGEMSAEQVKQIEDKAILDVLELQRSTNIDVLSDGEIRRSGWSGGFSAAVDGYVDGTPAVSMRMHTAGETAPSPVPQGLGSMGGRPRVIGEKLHQRRRITQHEVDFLREHAGDKPYKATMPAVTYVVSRAYNPEITGKAYPTRMDVLRDAAGIVRKEVEALIAEGTPYIQLDNPHYTDYLEASLRERWEAVGVDQKKALAEDIEADNICLRGLHGPKVTLAMHLCRGNAGRGPTEAAGWHKSGSYDWVAEQLFTQLDVDTFLLEYDDERAGSFEPLRFMPKGKTVVLGLITTKHHELETADQVIRRIEEASKYVALDDLTLSPQCGFASTAAGNPLTVDDEKRKLELVVEVARKVWPKG